MGWYFVGLVMWGTTLMVAVGLVINNIQRQFPIYWWTPLDLRKAKVEDEETVPDARGGVKRKESRLQQRYDQDDEKIRITGAEVLLPEAMSLNAEETKVLERLRERLRRRVDEKDMDTDSRSERSSAEFTVVPSRSDAGDGARSSSGSMHAL